MRAKSLAFQALFAALLLTNSREYRWSASAQDYTTPASWRSPNVTLSVSERVALASGALNRAIAELRADTAQLNGMARYDQTAILYAYLAQFDGLTNQTLYRDRLKGWFPIVEKAHPGFLGQLPYGYAAAQAYAVYHDTDFLDHAVTTWSSAQLYTLSEGEISAEKSNMKPSFNLSRTCSGITMAGGTFWTPTADDLTIRALSVGYFFVLSALLAKLTSNTTYLDAATLSGSFIKGHLLNRDNKLQDSISAKSTDACTTHYYVDGASPDSSGLFVEGMALLTPLTKDASDIQTMKDVLYAATTNTDWLNKDGIICVGDRKTGNMLLPRALGTVYRANTTYSDLRNYIKLFLGNQYNAIRGQATSGGSNVYGPSWVGPANDTFVAKNQITAIAPLVEVIGLQDQDPLSNGGSDGQSDGRNNSTSHGGSDGEPDGSSSSSFESAPIGVIVGGVVGGLAVIGLVILFLLLHRRKEKQRLSLVPGNTPNSNTSNTRERTNSQSATPPSDSNDHYVVTPFLSHPEPYHGPTTAPSAIHRSDPNARSIGSGFLVDQNRAVPTDQRSELWRRNGPSCSFSGAGNALNPEKRRAVANALAARQQYQQQHEQRESEPLPSLSAGSSGAGEGSESDNNATSGSAASAALSSDIASSSIATEELVRMLNQRLQPQVWTEDEVLPEYDDVLQDEEDREARGARRS